MTLFSLFVVEYRMGVATDEPGGDPDLLTSICTWSSNEQS